jgi:hypothetical protein
VTDTARRSNSGTCTGDQGNHHRVPKDLMDRTKNEIKRSEEESVESDTGVSRERSQRENVFNEHQNNQHNQELGMIWCGLARPILIQKFMVQLVHKQRGLRREARGKE